MGYEIRSRTTVELVDGAFQLYRNHFLQFMAITVPAYAAIFTPPMLVSLALTGHGVSAAPKAPTPALIATAAASSLISALGSMLVMYTVTIAVAVAFREGSVSTANVIPRAMSNFVRYVGVALLGLVQTIFFFFLFIVPGFIVMLNWMLASQVVVFEANVSGSAALERSKKLMYGMRGRLATLIFLVQVSLSAATSMLSHYAEVFHPLVGGVVAILVQALIAPIGPCILTLAYIDARVRKEGYDMEMVAQQMATAAHVPALTPGQAT